MAQAGGRGFFVGRVRELAQLQARLAEATNVGPVTMMLSGVSGLGKSDLLGEFTRRIAGTATVLSGACMNLDGVFPYAPLIDALRRWRRAEGPDRVAELAGPAWPDVSGLIADFTGQELVEGALDSKSKVFGALTRMLEHIGRASPVVLVFEDLQWADQATLDLVAFLTQARPVDRLMLVGTYRPGLPSHHRLRGMLAAPEFIRRIHQMSLPGLSTEEIRVLLGSVGYTVDRETLRRYEDLTEGCPGDVLLLAAEGGPTDHVPPSLAEMLLAGIRPLSDGAQEVVQVVAVAGRRVSDQLLARTCGLEPEQRVRAVRECLDRAVLVLDRAEGAYRFQNRLLRDAIHDTLQVSERVRVHRAMAEALAGDPTLGLSAPLELAYHWSEARAWPEELAAGVKAGAFAAQMSAFAEAEIHYTRVLDLWSRVDDPETVAGTTRHQVLFAAADAARWAGHIDNAINHVREAIAEVDPAVAPQQAASLYERLGSYLWEADASGEDASDAYRRAHEILRDQGPSALRARALAAMATGKVRAGQYERAYAQADEALTEAIAVGARPEQGRALNSSGLALAMLDKVEDGIASLREAVRVADEVGHLEDLLRAYGNLSVVLDHAGRLAEAVEVLEEAQTRMAALELFHTRQSGVITNNLGAILARLGRWDRAAELLDSILTDRPVKESTYQRLTRAEIHVAQGRYDDAQALLDDIRSEPAVDPRFVGPLYACMAELALWQADPATAGTVVERGLDAIAGTENAFNRMQLYAIGLWAAADRAGMPPGPDRRARDSSAGQAAHEARRKAVLVEADALMAAVRPIASDDASRDIAALARLCAAEHARAAGHDTGRMWADVADDWAAMSRPYPTAYARFRQAEAAVRERRKTAAAQAARLALDAARSLHAAPLIGRIEAAAEVHRLILTEPPERPAATPPPAHPADGFGITDRELLILREAANGATNEAIGRTFGITGNTVGVHLNHIYKKMGVASRAQAVAIAVARGFFSG